MDKLRSHLVGDKSIFPFARRVEELCRPFDQLRTGFRDPTAIFRIKAMEQRLANQEKAAKEKAEREEKVLRQNKLLKKALDSEKQKLEEE